MANSRRLMLEAVLRDRRLDRTLTTALPVLEHADPTVLAPLGVTAVDTCLGGGLSRGQLSELTGPCSSGRTSLLLQVLSAATRRGELAALVDTFDRLDVASAASAGVDFERLLWIRGEGSGIRDRGSKALDPWPLIPDPYSDRVIGRALKALNLVLQAGGFGVVAIDLIDAAPAALGRIPFTTWLRVQRVIEGSGTACVLLAPFPLARSAGGLTLLLTGRSIWRGSSNRSRRLVGMDMHVRVVSPRMRIDGDVVAKTIVGNRQWAVDGDRRLETGDRRPKTLLSH
jgi:hypothetical protein